MPHCADFGPCYAPDMVGMGSSSKPDIKYSVFDHIAYLEAWLLQLNLSKVTLVMHGWGSVVGFELIRRHPELFKACVCFEGHLRPVKRFSMLSLPMQQLGFELRGEEQLERRIVSENMLIEQFMPDGMVHALSEEDWDVYRKPFLAKEHRQPLLQFARELPFGDQSRPVLRLIKRYSRFMQRYPLPKVLLYANPGFTATMETLTWCHDHWSHVQLLPIGQAFHYPMETCPQRFSHTLLAGLGYDAQEEE